MDAKQSKKYTPEQVAAWGRRINKKYLNRGTLVRLCKLTKASMNGKQGRITGHNEYNRLTVRLLDLNKDVAVAPDKVEKLCETCKFQASKSCGHCFSVGYCSVECQGRHWDTHKRDCSHTSRT